MFVHHQCNDHKLCQLCLHQFKRIPSANNCPGVPIRLPDVGEVIFSQLSFLNRTLVDGASPVAYSNYDDSKRRNPDFFIYHLSDTVILDNSLPTAYLRVSDIPEPSLNTYQMREEGLEPLPNAKPIGVILRYSFQEKDYH